MIRAVRRGPRSQDSSRSAASSSSSWARRIARAKLAESGIAARVVSMPSTSLYDKQDKSYKSMLLPAGVPKVAIEAGVTDYWWKYVGHDGAVVGIDTFGESAPGPALFKFFGFTVERVVETVRKVLG